MFRQNYGCSHLVVGRDHAGVGDHYHPLHAQRIFDEIPRDALELRPLRIDWTFFCSACDGMASARTCPHGPERRLLISGTRVREMLRAGDDLPIEFTRPAIAEILREAELARPEAEPAAR